MSQSETAGFAQCDVSDADQVGLSPEWKQSWGGRHLWNNAGIAATSTSFLDDALNRSSE